ncbi:hypothetical protein [Streptomyces sp. NPDC003996]
MSTIAAQVVSTRRLDLLALHTDHAEEMATVLSDPAQHHLHRHRVTPPKVCVVRGLMSAFREIVGELREFAPWQVQLFATGCAQRLLPLADACASERTARLYLQGLDAAWSAASAAQREELARTLDQVPEMSAQSSDEIEYWALRSVLVLTCSLRADLAGDPAKPGRRACSGALELHEAIDDTLTHPEPTGTRTIDPRDMPSPGPWENREIAAERATLAVLRASTIREAAVAEVHSLSADHADDLREVIPGFLRAGASTGGGTVHNS